MMRTSSGSPTGDGPAKSGLADLREHVCRSRSTEIVHGGNLALRRSRLVPVLLDARGAKPGEPVLVDRILPGEEFLDREGIAAAGFLERQQSPAHGGDDLGFAPDDPSLGARCRQIGNGQRAAIRPDDVFGPRSKGLAHQMISRTPRQNQAECNGPALKICLSSLDPAVPPASPSGWRQKAWQ